MAGTCSPAFPSRLASGLSRLHPCGPSSCNLVRSPRGATWQNHLCSRNARWPGPSTPALGAFSSPQVRPGQNPSRRPYADTQASPSLGNHWFAALPLWGQPLEGKEAWLNFLPRSPYCHSGHSVILIPYLQMKKPRLQRAVIHLRSHSRFRVVWGPCVHALCGHYHLWDEQMRGGRIGSQEPLSVQ